MFQILTDALMPDMFEKAIKENNIETVYKMISGTSKVPIEIRNKASQTGKWSFALF